MSEKSKVGAPARKRRPAWVRGLVWIAAIFTVWHVFATVLWVFPYTPLREIVPGGGNKALTSYMIPMFGQSWSVFAPEPARSELRLSVRALVRDASGRAHETEWVDADRIELATTRYNLFPSFGAVSAEKLAHAHNSGYFYLGRAQQEVIEADFVGENWLSDLESDLQRAGQEQAYIYLIAEKNTTAYATQVAKAVWGDQGEIEKVQYLVTNQDVVPFEFRDRGQIVRADPRERTTGWREPYVRAGQDEQAFANTFMRWYDSYYENQAENG